jgi:predicted DNA-binding helix-hairpin-helix protein
MFKTLVSNACANDCKYCPLRAGHDATPRCSLTPEEIVRAFLPYWESRQVIGLFLTSGVCGNPDAAMERMLAAAELLRRRERYRGILHLKIIPGASDAAIDRALALASGVSLNIETAGEEHFAKLTARKDYLQLRHRAPQAHRGADGEGVALRTGEDEHAVRGGRLGRDRPGSGALHGRTLRADGVARHLFQRLPARTGRSVAARRNSPATNAELLAREHRLYQTDFLMRKYGFAAEEIGFNEAGNLPLDVDPKEFWARRHPERFPVDVNRAGKAELLRVPGLGPVAVRRILNARKNGGRVRSLESHGVRGALARKAMAWIKLGDIEGEPGLAFIAAQVFEQEAAGGIEHEVEGEDGAILAAARVGVQQGRPDHQEGGGFDELHGVEGDAGEEAAGLADRRVDDGAEMVAGGASVAAAVEEAADAAEGVADGETGDGEVGHMPQGEPLAAGEDHERGGGQQQAAVEDQAALVDAHDVQRGLPVVGPIGDDVGDARADDAAGHEPKAEIGGEAFGALLAAAEPQPGQDGGQEAQAPP